MFDRAAEYSVVDIARLARANLRSVQHWAASGLLMAKSETDRKGTGSPSIDFGRINDPRNRGPSFRQ